MNNITIKFRLFLGLDLVYNNQVIAIHNHIKTITKYEVWDEEKVKIEKFF